MLTSALIDQVLTRMPTLRIGVVGDLFLDRYLDIAGELTEPSVETGLDAYQVVQVRSYPGAAGTVLNNLVALGVGRVSVISLIGQDGEGFELKRALTQRGVAFDHIIETQDRYTPTYTKPMLAHPGQTPRELSRLDIRTRQPLTERWNDLLVQRLPAFAADLDALIVLDQVREAETGVVTSRVRACLAELAVQLPRLFILADSRYRIGHFQNVCLKPNRSECLAAVANDEVAAAAHALAHQAGRTVYCTCGEEGILVVEHGQARAVAGYRVAGPIDPVGAGDSTSAGIACARAAGLDAAQAAAFGNLVASITIQQIGTTGTATPAQVQQRWAQIQDD